MTGMVPLLALLAATCFALQVILDLCAVGTGRLNLTTLGLFLLTCAVAVPIWQARMH